MLGALSQQLRKEGLHSGNSSERLLGLSVSSTLKIVRSFESPPASYDGHGDPFGEMMKIFGNSMSTMSIFTQLCIRFKDEEEGDQEVR